jgi:predicted transcriptional regulator
MHIQGHSNYAIAAELGVSNGRVSQYMKEAAREHPLAT